MVIDPNNFSLFKRQNSPYWYYYVNRNGKKIWRSTGEKTKTKAIGVIYDRMSRGDILKGLPPYDEIVFQDFASDFWDFNTCPHIQEKIKRGGRFSLEESEKYQSRLDKYIMPTFKDIRIVKLDRYLINEWFINLPEMYNLGFKTCNDILSEFKIILDYAVYRGILEKNPARDVKQFLKKCKPRGCYTEQEIKAIFSVRWDNILAYTACRLAETTGLRMGEVIALKLKNLCCREDLQGNKVYYLHVDSAFARKEGIKCTKSGKARDIKIHPSIRKMLLDLPTVKDTIDPNTLFFTTDSVNPMCSKTIRDALYKAMEEVGIDREKRNLSFHSFRHFANSHYIPVLGGERTRMLIGHESEDMTKNYLHDTNEDYEQIKSIQEKLLSI